MEQKNYILNKEEAGQKLHRMALELAEDLNGDLQPVIIIGIRNNGTIIAEKMGVLLKSYVTNEIKIISVSMDKSRPGKVTLSEQLNFDDSHVVIADDVTNSGKALLYALKPLLDFHPKTIQTLVLVERMHKLFPVKPDYVGLSVATTLQDHIQVEVVDGEVMGAYID
ncbi:MAG: phosphoribosyltransferase [Chitinophagaceae bacterium]|nr:phosphoribosyltransferase [Chitinophagaceae bacterium]MDP1764900.1 phosphoribosyltransferase family protein [Sediminibacterium sp.]MDP1812749.1 phosphoribosyltransferase family protein [Sediminibacterium sp.]MDP3129645.1 phosphoribosyltransferase family protein [Sediminibacterium sp.]MDP3667931.1 phosphoribosyltransferase family protein [Sediminibacterium sp.]